MNREYLKDLEIQRLRKAVKDAEYYLRFPGIKHNVARHILSGALSAEGFLKSGGLNERA